jgi:saccharopine dehydrogenase-like NADP-dependent oxidoreductase
MKKVLLLGAGLVTKPLVDYLLAKPEVELTVATRTVKKAQTLVGEHPRGKAIELNVKNDEELAKLVKDADVAISLLPYTYHVQVAKHCLEGGTHLITTSYVSPAMKELDEAAEEKGLLFLNEIGLDPGIDHMSAMKIIDDVKRRGGKIVSFESICGGLPAPEANDNPYGYKFSWSPRGVVMAGRNNARYLKDGEIVEIDGSELFEHHWYKEVDSLGQLEVYPNRDSLIYKDLYHLDDAKTIFRGTFRNVGWSETLAAISKMGFLDDKERPELKDKSFAEVTASLVNHGHEKDVKENTAKYLNIKGNSKIIERLEWLGLFSDEKPKTDEITYLDILASQMLEKMPYKENERDMIVLQHQFVAEFPDGSREEITSLMIDYGIPGGDSAMARTVSLPAAIATHLVLQNKIGLKGVKIPVYPAIYQPVLEELERLGIKMQDTVKKIEPVVK